MKNFFKRKKKLQQQTCGPDLCLSQRDVVLVVTAFENQCGLTKYKLIPGIKGTIAQYTNIGTVDFIVTSSDLVVIEVKTKQKKTIHFNTFLKRKFIANNMFKKKKTEKKGING